MPDRNPSFRVYPQGLDAGIILGAKFDAIKIGHVLEDVGEECLDQFEKWGQQNHHNLMWNAILSEEVGEAIKEILAIGPKTTPSDPDERLEHELIQVAAVAVSWIDCLRRTRANRKQYDEIQAIGREVEGWAEHLRTQETGE